MNNLLLYFLAVLPIGLIIWLIFKLDKFEKESVWQLWLVFLIGGLTTLPIFFWQGWFATTHFEDPTSLWRTIVTSFLVVSLSEEIVKGLAVFAYPFRQNFLNDRMDGIVYGVVTAMGFAAVENIFYAYQFGLPNVLVRALTAVPAHAAFGAITGYYFGLAKFNEEKKWIYIFRGMLIAVGLHGLYDFFIIQGFNENLMGGALVVLAFSIYLSIEMIRLHLKHSKGQFEEITEESMVKNSSEPEEEDC